MDKNKIWHTVDQSNGEQTVFDRVINGLRPRIQFDKRSEEVKAKELADAMKMLEQGRILALNHNAISQDVQTETPTEEKAAKDVKPPTKKKARKARKAKAEPAKDEPETDGFFQPEK